MKKIKFKGNQSNTRRQYCFGWGKNEGFYGIS